MKDSIVAGIETYAGFVLTKQVADIGFTGPGDVSLAPTRCVLALYVADIDSAWFRF